MTRIVCMSQTRNEAARSTISQYLISNSTKQSKKKKTVKATHYFVTVTNKSLFSFSLNKRQRTAKGPTRRSIPICTSTRDPRLSLPAVHRRAAGGLRLQPSREKGDAGSPGAPHCYVRQPRAGFNPFFSLSLWKHQLFSSTHKHPAKQRA